MQFSKGQQYLASSLKTNKKLPVKCRSYTVSSWPIEFPLKTQGTLKPETRICYFSAKVGNWRALAQQRFLSSNKGCLSELTTWEKKSSGRGAAVHHSKAKYQPGELSATLFGFCLWLTWFAILLLPVWGKGGLLSWHTSILLGRSMKPHESAQFVNLILIQCHKSHQ